MIKLDYRHYYYVLSLDIPGIIPRKLDIHMTNNWDPGHISSRKNPLSMEMIEIIEIPVFSYPTG